MTERALPDFVPAKLFYRADEVAPLVGVSAKTIKRWMGQGIFGALKATPNGVRITYDGLAAYYHARNLVEDA